MNGTANRRAAPAWLDGLPTSWKVDRLKDIVPRIVGGGTPAIADPENWSEEGIIWITPTDFTKFASDAVIKKSARKITHKGLQSSSATLVPEGTVIMASRATIGSAKLAGCEMATNQGFISFVCDDTLSNRFLYYVVSGLLGPIFADTAAGTTFNEISRGVAKRYDIGFPPLPEQMRIAAYLDASCAAIDRAVESKQKQIETLDALRKSIIQRAVTQGLNPKVKMKNSAVEWLGRIPIHWKVQKLKRVFSKVEYGISESTEQEGTYSVLKMGNIVQGEIVFTKIEYVPDVAPTLILEKDDLLFNRTNSLDQVAKVGIFRGDRSDNITFASYLVRLRANHKNHPHFLNYLVNTDIFLGLARKMAIPSVQQANLNPTRYCRLEIPVPPLPEQEAIAAYLDTRSVQIREIEKRLNAQITTLTAYRKSLIHKCVTGKRRISDADVAKIEAYV